MVLQARRISQIRPEHDETLMSFLRRAQIDAGYSDRDFQLLAAGVLLPDARRAERRCFDWDSLARFFNAEPGELFAMSERSFYSGYSDTGRICVPHTPWAVERGYGAHCPACLRESAYWRREWLQPCSVTCERHRALLVDVCDGCGAYLGDCSWSSTAPICPKCGAHLALNPIVPAPKAVLEQTREYPENFRRITRYSRWNVSGIAWAYFGAWWHACRIFQEETANDVPALRDCLDGLAGHQDPESAGTRFARAAVRRAHDILCARALFDLDSQFVPFYRDSVLGDRRADARSFVRFRMFEVANELGIECESLRETNIQTLMSFTNWAGSNEAPIAA